MKFKEIVKSIRSDTGYDVSIKFIDGVYYSRPNQFEKNEGFIIKIMSLDKENSLYNVVLDVENNAFNNLRNIGNSSIDKFKKFSRIIDDISLEIVSINIGHEEIGNNVKKMRGANWHFLKIELKMKSLGKNQKITNDLKHIIEKINYALMVFFELVNNKSNDEELGLPEGARMAMWVNKYERNPKNRKECIDEFGTDCKICNFSFRSKFGIIGEDFIHVHHLIPVSKMGGEYRINPTKDLIPVCPNCHAMLHRKDPPYTPSELKEIVIKSI